MHALMPWAPTCCLPFLPTYQCTGTLSLSSQNPLWQSCSQQQHAATPAQLLIHMQCDAAVAALAGTMQSTPVHVCCTMMQIPLVESVHSVPRTPGRGLPTSAATATSFRAGGCESGCCCGSFLSLQSLDSAHDRPGCTSWPSECFR